MRKRIKIIPRKGFTLLELLITVSILSLLTLYTILGLENTTSGIDTKQSASVIKDTIYKAELEILTNWYQKNTIRFLPNYLLLISEKDSQNLDLRYEEAGVSPCTSEEEKINWSEQGVLVKRNSAEILSVKQVEENGEECINFKNASDQEWSYQLINNSGSKNSGLIRFIHFEIDRKNTSDMNIENNNYELQIESPYGKKILYQNQIPANGYQSIFLTHPEGFTEEIIIQN